jgi:hypothetical protein
LKVRGLPDHLAFSRSTRPFVERFRSVSDSLKDFLSVTG